MSINSMDMASSDAERRMTFTEHLSELRSRLIKSMIAIAGAFVICYALSEYIFDFLRRPLEGQEGVEWMTLTPFEGFLTYLRLGAYGGLIVASPIVIYQICAFIFPGLRRNEKRAVFILLAGGVFLALAGFFVAYTLVFPMVLPYVISWTPADVRTDLQMSATIALLIKGLLAFSVMFQFPMAVLVLVYLELLTPATLKQYRKIAVVGIAVVSAMLTPPEPLTMIFMMVPLVMLYEMSIWMSYIILRRKRKAESSA